MSGSPSVRGGIAISVTVELGPQTLDVLAGLTNAIARAFSGASPPPGEMRHPARGVAASAEGPAPAEAAAPAALATELPARAAQIPSSARAEARPAGEEPARSGSAAFVDVSFLRPSHDGPTSAAGVRQGAPAAAFPRGAPDWTPAQEALIWRLRKEGRKVDFIRDELGRMEGGRNTTTAAVYTRLAAIRARKGVNADPRDARLSVATRQLAEDAAGVDIAPVGWDVVEYWARHNGLGIGEDRVQLLRAVNAKRAAEKLPPFQVRASVLAPKGDLPAPSVGGRAPEETARVTA